MAQPRSSSADESRTFFTIGYSGRTIDSVVDTLLEVGVSTLIDIRHMPVSRYRPEFSKRNLDARLQNEGITYHHDRELGIPAQVRREHGYPNHGESLWVWYDENVLSQQPVDSGWLDELGSGPVAVMCVESDAMECHRHLLGDALRAAGMTVRHL